VGTTADIATDPAERYTTLAWDGFCGAARMSRVSTLTVANAQLFDGSNRDLLAGTLLVVDGRIASLDAGVERGDVHLDARGGVVLPGLIDAHFHAYGISMDGFVNNGSPLSYVALMGARRLEKALRRGFTTVRDPGGGDAGIARAIAEDVIRTPRYLWMGAALSQTGGHGDPRSAELDLCACGAYSSEVVDGVDDLRRAVRDRFRRGAHAIKIMASGGVMSLTDPIRIPQYSAEEIAAVSDEATRRGSYVAAHAYSPEAIAHAVRNGVRSIEHGNLLDESTAALMASSGAVLDATLAAYAAIDRRADEIGLNPIMRAKNREVLEDGARAAALALAAGVPVGFGTDLMGPFENEQLLGLRLQVEAIGVLDALRSATSVNAALIGRDDLGVLREGAVGDLLVLPGNPFDDASVLWTEGPDRVVIRSGAIVR